MTKVKIKEFQTTKYYDLTFRWTVKSFPKHITHNQYRSRLLKKLKINENKVWHDPMLIKGRMSLFMNYVSEKEKNRICNKALKIDDGIFREVLVYESPS